MVGAYSTSNSFYGVWVAIAASLLGLVCAWAGVPVVPMVLGLGPVIGDTMEASLRQALAVSDGSLLIFVQRPVAAVITVCCTVALAQPLIRALRRS